MKVLNNILETIGKTPIVKLNRINESHADIYVKLESLNPGGSIKDRVAIEMIENAERTGKLKKGDIIIESTSGNTGIGLGMVCAIKGYKLIIVMPDCVSHERLQILNAYGAETILTDKNRGMKGCLEKLEELKKLHKNHFIPDQFSNPCNPETHYNFTGKEIWDSFGEELDVFICGIGTGGSFSGISKHLKEKNSQIKTFALEPMRSPLISTGTAGPHGIQGIGMSLGYIPSTFNPSVMDEIVTISFEKAKEMTNQLAKNEGIFCGISSGANVAAAIEIANRPENKGKKILTMIMDAGERYLSSNIFY